jgi:hypothetical protein
MVLPASGFASGFGEDAVAEGVGDVDATGVGVADVPASVVAGPEVVGAVGTEATGVTDDSPHAASRMAARVATAAAVVLRVRTPRR